MELNYHKNIQMDSKDLRKYYMERADRKVSFSVFYQRVHTMGWDLEKAISHPKRLKKKKFVTYKGKMYTLKEVYDKFCRVNGLSYMAFSNRIFLHGFSVEEALTIEKNKNRRRH